MKVYGALEKAQLEWFDSGSLPSASGVNIYRAIYCTDKKQILVSDGTNWLPTALLYATSGTLPTASAYAYQLVYQTDTNTIVVSNGSAWINVSTVADGAVSAVKLDSTTTTSSMMVRNLALTTSVNSNILTISVVTKSGTNASASDPISVGFRSATATSGVYNFRNITSALSISVSSSIGTSNGVAEYIYVYLIDNAGTPELAVGCDSYVDEGSLITTTAISGGTTRTTVYSTTARSNVPIRLIGRILITEATAGTFASNATEVSTLPFDIRPRSCIWLDTFNAKGGTNTNILRFSNITKQIGTDITLTQSAANGDSFTINNDGLYWVGACIRNSSGGFSANCWITVNLSNTATAAGTLAMGSAAADSYGGGSGSFFLKKNDVVRCYSSDSIITSDATVYFKIERVK